MAFHKLAENENSEDYLEDEKEKNDKLMVHKMLLELHDIENESDKSDKVDCFSPSISEKKLDNSEPINYFDIDLDEFQQNKTIVNVL